MQRIPVLTDRSKIRKEEIIFCVDPGDYKRANRMITKASNDKELEPHREWLHWILPNRAPKSCRCRECRRRHDPNYSKEIMEATKDQPQAHSGWYDDWFPEDRK